MECVVGLLVVGIGIAAFVRVWNNKIGTIERTVGGLVALFLIAGVIYFMLGGT